jgi:hypothetical protein
LRQKRDRRERFAPASHVRAQLPQQQRQQRHKHHRRRCCHGRLAARSEPQLQRALHPLRRRQRLLTHHHHQLHYRPQCHTRLSLRHGHARRRHPGHRRWRAERDREYICLRTLPRRRDCNTCPACLVRACRRGGELCPSTSASRSLSGDGRETASSEQLGSWAVPLARRERETPLSSSSASMPRSPTAVIIQDEAAGSPVRPSHGRQGRLQRTGRRFSSALQRRAQLCRLRPTRLRLRPGRRQVRPGSVQRLVVRSWGGRALLGLGRC